MTRSCRQSQGGYTLVELVIASAIGALLMGAIVSVIYTSVNAASTATARVEASSQIRNFEFFAYTDFDGANVSDLGTGCTWSAPCSSPVNLSGIQAGSPTQTYQVTYSWDQTNHSLQRQVGSSTINAATNVSNFTWYVDTNQTVLVTLSIMVGTYTESQTFRFFPRRNP